MTIAYYLAMPYPSSRWRRDAHGAICAVAESYVNTHPEPYDTVELLRLVDDAYPFGERAMYPYKCWLTERRLFMQHMGGGPDAVTIEPPTDADYQACLVAIDLLGDQRVGCEAAAVALLDDQAPRRLNRPCPVCGVDAGANCRNLDGLGTVTARGLLIVPHVSRVEPNGPLFTRTP